jgi:hypothetical protein
MPDAHATSCSRRRHLKTRLETRLGRPAFDRHVHIGRIDVEPAEAPSRPLGREQRRSGAQKEIQYEIAVPGYVLERIGNQPRRLDGRIKVRSSPRLPRIEFTEA